MKNIRGLKCSKPHTYSTSIGEEKENQICRNMFFLGHFEHGKCKNKQQQKQSSTFEK